MFEAIRRNQRVLLFLLVLLIFPAFAFFGISGYDRFFSGGDAVATVGDSAITTQEFNNARRAQIDNMRRFLGDQFDPALLDSPAARNEILDGLIAQRVLAQEAASRRISIPDLAVFNAIHAIPSFRNEQGEFDRDRYRAMVAAQGMTEVGFEERVRADLAMQMIPQSVSESAIMPQSVATRIVSLQQQQRRYRLRRFEPENFIEGIAIDEAAARKYYDEHAAEFQSPESAKIEYLVLSQATLAGQVEVTDAEVNEYYTNNKARYVQGEQRAASHILVTASADAPAAERDAARAKAQALLDKLKGGADFAELAKAESQDPGSADNGGDLGLFDRESMVKPFADAAFALEKGALSDVVETEFGFHILKVTDIRDQTQQPLDKVRGEIESLIRSQKARQSFLESAETFSNTVFEQPDSLAPAADKLNLKVQSLDDLRRNGGPAVPPGSPLGNPKVLRAIFSEEALRNKVNTEAIDLGDNTLVAARVLEHRPSKLQDFEAVEVQAQAKVRAIEAGKAAVAAGEAELARLQGGGEPTGFDEEVTVSRAAAQLPPQVAKPLFNLPAERLPAFIGVSLGNRGYQIAQLLEVIPAAEKVISEGVEQYRERSAGNAGASAFDAYLELLKAKIPIERNVERLATPGTEG
ncbi:MAG: SurA N-terminal domain-containing protein [Burkholderiaceae bacterium]